MSSNCLFPFINALKCGRTAIDSSKLMKINNKTDIDWHRLYVRAFFSSSVPSYIVKYSVAIDALRLAAFSYKTHGIRDTVFFLNLVRTTPRPNPRPIPQKNPASAEKAAKKIGKNHARLIACPRKNPRSNPATCKNLGRAYKNSFRKSSSLV